MDQETYARIHKHLLRYDKYTQFLIDNSTIKIRSFEI